MGPLPNEDRASRPPRSEPRGIGLRAQIMWALLAGLALAVVLVGFAVQRLASRTIDAERQHAAHIAAQAAAALVSRVDAPTLVLDAAERALLRSDGVSGLELYSSDGRLIERRGVHGGGGHAQARLAGGTIRVWLADTHSRAGTVAPGEGLVRLVVLYASVTSVAIGILCYVLLTRLIVRPVEELRRTSERIAAGRLDTRASVHGAREVQALALSFNAMADDLRHERDTLQRRLKELESRTEELRTAQDSLVRSEKLASAGRLAAGVAHEIGNPLAAILGLVELVREGSLSGSQRDEFLTRIAHETERIHRIIEDFLNFARAGADAAQPTSRVDLALVLEHAVQLVSPQKDLRRITIERRTPTDIAEVVGDADRLTQVVLNLLLNAADAIDGDGTITLELEQAEPFWVTLTVTDSGHGLPDAVLDRIFEPFFTTKPKGEGTGLGLAVCWMIVTQFGGTIAASNAPGGGARFTLRLRVAA